MVSQVLENLIIDEIIECKSIELLLDNGVKSTKEIASAFIVNINLEKFAKNYQVHSIVNSSLDLSCENKMKKEKSLQASELDNDGSNVSTTDSSKIEIDNNSSFNESDSSFYKNAHISYITKFNIDYEDAESLMNWMILQFMIKYETANYENIKKVAKFDNALLSFVSQQLDSKKFKKNYGHLLDKLENDKIALSIIHFLKARKWIEVSNNNIIHNDLKFAEEKQNLESYT